MPQAFARGSCSRGVGNSGPKLHTQGGPRRRPALARARQGRRILVFVGFKTNPKRIPLKTSLCLFLVGFKTRPKRIPPKTSLCLFTIVWDPHPVVWDHPSLKSAYSGIKKSTEVVQRECKPASPPSMMARSLLSRKKDHRTLTMRTEVQVFDVQVFCKQ